MPRVVLLPPARPDLADVPAGDNDDDDKDDNNNHDHNDNDDFLGMGKGDDDKEGITRGEMLIHTH